MKFSIKDFVSKCDQIRSSLQVLFIFCAKEDIILNSSSTFAVLHFTIDNIVL